MSDTSSRIPAEVSATAPNAIRDAKAQLRAVLRPFFRGLTPVQRRDASVRACERLRGQFVWSRASSVLFYASRADELDIELLVTAALEAGKFVALPQFHPTSQTYRACRISTPLAEVPLGHFGIREPGEHCPSVALNQLDLLLVPGVAFDARGRRLGRGRGFYDRLLVDVRGTKCGLAFDEQLVPEIPVEPHDVLLNCILTPTRWVEVRPGGLGDDLVG